MNKENRDIKLSEVLEELYALREENQQLKVDNDFLQKELRRITSLGMFEFANEFCNDTQLEDAGHAFARSLGVGVPTSDEDLAEEKAIADGENHYYEMGTALYGDDF